MPVHARVAIAALVAVAICLAGSRGAAASDSHALDERGRRFRVRFDPRNRILLGLQSGMTGIDRQLDAGTRLETGVFVSTSVQSAVEGERIRWILEHRFAAGTLDLTPEVPGGSSPLRLTAYRGTFLRHADAPYVFLPSNPPRRLYFPFDIGVEVEVGRAETSPRPSDGGAEVLRLGLARASLLLDPWRPGTPGDALLMGVGVRYDLDIRGAPALADGADTVHRVAPFTDVSVRLRLQDDPGRTVLDIDAHAIPHWSSAGGWRLAVEGRLRAERVLVAINDQPLSAVLCAGTRWAPDEHVYWVTAGLTVGFQLQ
jgi:hypothetical protein